MDPGAPPPDPRRSLEHQTIGAVAPPPLPPGSVGQWQKGEFEVVWPKARATAPLLTPKPAWVDMQVTVRGIASDMPPAALVALRIMGAPMPAMFILESPSFLVPLGIIMPNMDCSMDFLPLPPEDGPSFLRMLSPQKVQKMVTSSPIAAAPLAMMSAAITLSKSPLNKMMVFLVVSTGSLRYGLIRLRTRDGDSGRCR